MLGIYADDPHHALAVDHLAFIANFLDGRSNFHVVSFLRILPRAGSRGINSTSTRSPGTSRTKFRSTIPTKWANTFCCVSNATS
jgi:hypothetical protein